MSHKLTDDLDGEIELSQNLEKTVENAIDHYLKFDEEGKFEKRISHEIKSIFQEKKSNKTYFFNPPDNNKLKPLGFNQMIHILIKRLWDEEEFALYSKVPKEISFLDNESNDINSARVSFDDAKKYTKTLRVLPFVTPESDFYSRMRPEQVRICLQWLQKGNSMQNFLNRLKLVGVFPQTVFYAGQNLIKIANEYQNNPDMQIFEDELPGEKILEDKAGLFTKIIMGHPLVRQGYLKFSEQTLKRIIIKEAEELIGNKPNLKHLYELMFKAKSSGLKLTEEQIAKAAASIINEYQKRLKAPVEDIGAKKNESNANGKEAQTRQAQELLKQPIQPFQNAQTSQSKQTQQDAGRVIKSSTINEKEENELNNITNDKDKKSQIDLAHAYDRLVYELRNSFKSQNTVSFHVIIKTITNRVRETYPSIVDNHLTLIFLYLKDLERKKHTIQEGLTFFKMYGEKFKVPLLDSYILYFLLITDKTQEFMELSLSDFVASCMEDDIYGSISEREANILKSLFGNLPKEVSINHFYQVKEKLKQKVEDPGKKKAIDMLAEYVHVRIAEKKGNWAVEKMMENGLIE